MIQPIVGLICCQQDVQGQKAQAVHEKYIDAVSNAGGVPVLLPRELNDCAAREQLFAALDGIVLTGSYSNVNPALYHATHKESYMDTYRDTLSFHLLKYALHHDKPLLAICRGHQEMNVFFGGTLIPDWRKDARFTYPHLADHSRPLDEQYAEAHPIELQSGGILSAFPEKHWQVNSLHQQCVGEIGQGLKVEALAPDGMIEGLSVPTHRFMLGVQWHPEFNSTKNPLSKFIFSRFIKECTA